MNHPDITGESAPDLAESLIDEITITRIPIVLGDGIPLFGPLQADLKLNHINTTVYDFGFVQTTYQVIS